MQTAFLLGVIGIEPSPATGATRFMGSDRRRAHDAAEGFVIPPAGKLLLEQRVVGSPICGEKIRNLFFSPASQGINLQNRAPLMLDDFHPRQLGPRRRLIPSQTRHPNVHRIERLLVGQDFPNIAAIFLLIFAVKK